MFSKAFLLLAMATLLYSQAPPSPIAFTLKPIPFQLENGETLRRHAPATMAGGVAIFDFNQDGRPDIFFANGANIATLQKDEPKYANRLFRNDGNGVFTDVTTQSGLAGTGFDIGVAVGDYDNDGFPDLFVAGVHHNALYHNNRDGTFTDVTEKAGLAQPDPKYGPLWSVAAAFVDVNNDGLLDLFVVNYVQWDYATDPACSYNGESEYCNPGFYKGLPNQLFLNKGNGKFEDVSQQWGIRDHVGKGMGVGVADFDVDGLPDLFVTNDTYYNFFFHNLGGKFEEVAMDKGVALVEDGNFVSGMGLDFRDIDNDGYPDIAFVALAKQTFPLFKNNGGHDFTEVTASRGLRNASMPMSAFGLGVYDFDNDGWKDMFVTRGDVLSLPVYHNEIDQRNSVFRNPGSKGNWQVAEAGLDAGPAGRFRGCAFGDFDGDGKIDVVVTALGKPAEIWMNRSPSDGRTRSHWLNIALEGVKSNRDGIGARIKLTAKSGVQFNHKTNSVGYASSSAGPVHFGMGADAVADSIEIRWPSGIIQILKNVGANQIVTVKEAAH